VVTLGVTLGAGAAASDRAPERARERTREHAPKNWTARHPLHFVSSISPFLSPPSSGVASPAKIQGAYGFNVLYSGTPPITGTNQTIAIIDAFNSDPGGGNTDTAIQTDLQAFCSYYSLPYTASGSGQTLTVAFAQGSAAYDSGWANEICLDVEWAHAIAPGAKILLVLAKSASDSDLLGAVDNAVNSGATVVSMSWGGSEFSGQSTYDSHFNKSGVTFVSSSGDKGYGVSWPAASAYVLGIGGTTLNLDGSGNVTSETSWSGSGGGISAYTARPSYQAGWQNAAYRTVPDVGMLGDPNTGVAIYINGTWSYLWGGTSLSAPMWAGLIALANQHRGTPLSAAGFQLHSELYSLARGPVDPATQLYTVLAAPGAYLYFFDVFQGSQTGSPSPTPAGPPLDTVVGLGTPVANHLVPQL
jgi:subtilase family serine protease